ncbi:E2f transcription factor-like e2fe [Thalictrum thalictroides]|uniref:E2f transcription factor-like e2fe n=1 Tax=Thalictrum thalictroides TaxID=46969 RepID=A0A7J6US18_THATH|nr:E2f transcription factor-like e2fe [Thalictrum thalictroides]
MNQMDESIKKVSLLPSSATHHHMYCRKEKSLGLLCTNFLSLYDKGDIQSIELGDASRRLGIVRRRIYDIVNVLESIGILERKAKKEYSWKGFDGMVNALKELKESALSDKNFSSFVRTRALGDNGDEQSSDSNNASGQDNSSNADQFHKPCLPSKEGCLPSKEESKREKSLVLLTENFVKLLLCSDNQLLTFDKASKTLLEDNDNSLQMQSNSKAKVRRLYDIANVLSSLNLIEKTREIGSRKPAFRWLGISGTPENGSLLLKKREFGTDITNTGFKRNKFDGSAFQKMENKDFRNDINQKTVHQPQQSKHSSKAVVYGPFPAGFPKINDNQKNEQILQDRNSRASSYRPPYYNQALSDIFDHYVEAWNSWFAEVTAMEAT